MKSVAIIIPVFNSAKFLEECIESVINQSYKQLEIILVNDGSTDNSLNIIKHYAEIDNRIKYSSLENSGVSIARNTGIEMAEAEKIIFVDSDDIIPNNLVELLLTDEECDFAMCGYCVYDMKRNAYYDYVCPQFKGDIHDFCNCISDYLSPPYLLGPCFKMFSKEIINKWKVVFPPDISYGEDAEFVLSYLEHVSTICCYSDIGYTYRQYNSGTLSKRFRTDKMDIYNRIIRHILSLVFANRAEKCIDAIYRMYIQNYVEYSHELFSSALNYNEKKELFFQKGFTNNVVNYANEVSRMSIAQKLLIFSLKTKIFLPIYAVFIIRDRLKYRNKF